ncbi:hypothetical protein BDA99DRAFT_536469 [Phascolomyces articulosus]|uniref:Uncharacterized protein n=1 Tax=Phascolomyces articulosus TaxID=60185 RepID=A0AAD5K1Z4_9FUNG|nr:hypothetical protein BDA99DRAFT_536469 [Phascolomyces articulosus]
MVIVLMIIVSLVFSDEQIGFMQFLYLYIIKVTSAVFMSLLPWSDLILRTPHLSRSTANRYVPFFKSRQKVYLNGYCLYELGPEKFGGPTMLRGFSPNDISI